jgi:hypothetical protein
MNYIKLINQFWKLRRSKRITSLQTDLYFYLVQECNERDWENPFECSNKLICASISISEPSLGDARNRLKQLGLIDFSSGKRNESSPVYQLFYLNNFSRSRDEPLVETGDETGMKGEPIKETKLNQSKQNKTSFTGGAPPAKKKKDPAEANLYWQGFVNTFENFYVAKTKNKYEYLGQDWAALDKIHKFLKKRAEAGKFDFTETNLFAAFDFFLEKAWTKDEWLKNNFSISNLLSQINQIANATGATNGKPATGAGVSTVSILSKINGMPD